MDLVVQAKNKLTFSVYFYKWQKDRAELLVYYRDHKGYCTALKPWDIDSTIKGVKSRWTDVAGQNLDIAEVYSIIHTLSQHSEGDILEAVYEKRFQEGYLDKIAKDE